MSNESKSVAVPEENKMGVMPVGRLLFSMSLPMMLSMLVQALYNIVDSIFVAKLSEDALSAVSLAFPLQTLIFAVGGGILVRFIRHGGGRCNGVNCRNVRKRI